MKLVNESADKLLDSDVLVEKQKPGLREWLLRTSLQDLISGHNHSRDFNGSRAEYIYLRVRLLAFVFAVLAPLWIPVDLVLLSGNSFREMLALRLSFSAGLAGLGGGTGEALGLV